MGRQASLTEAQGSEMSSKRTIRLETSMSSSGRSRPRRVLAATSPQEDLPYSVELWNLPRTRVERTLGRANSVTLAHAIFTAAQKEHVGRRITLRQGDAVIAAAE